MRRVSGRGEKKELIWSEWENGDFFGHLFEWQYLVNQEEWMNSSDRKRESSSLEDEREFTDLLFGDLKESVEPVWSFGWDDVKKNEEIEEEKKERPALWHDSDDDTIMVDMRDTARNRKFRHEEEERKITGSELSKRLRTE